MNEYKQQIINDFNSRIDYDEGRFYIPVAKRLISSAKLQSGQQVLDIATGTGIVAIAAANIVGSVGKIIGVDISVGMLNKAKEKLATSGLQNVNFMEADAENIDFAENSFDRILSSLAICYLSNIPLALNNWYRWLKPNGLVVFNAWAEDAFPPSVLFRKVAQRYNIEVPNPNQPLGTIEKCRQFLQQADFQDIEIEIEQFGWYFQADVNNAEQMWAINSKNVFGYQVLQLSSQKLAQCKAEYVAEIQNLSTINQEAWCDAPIFFVSARK